MSRPLIGITTSSRPDATTGYPFVVAYALNVHAIDQAGGLPVMIPCNVDDDTLRALYERVDGILLPGGGDIAPSYYGAEPHPAIDDVNLLRDHTELTIARWAVEDHRPVLGICRGMQVMNVALGGTLIQDIPSLTTTELTHNITIGYPRGELQHDVDIHPDSQLAAILQTTRLGVNSIHHQAVDVPAPGLRVNACAPDGIIEGVEVPGHPFAVSVQWHPEDLTEYETMRRLFRAFVDSARAH